ncbi:hypothetical protein F5Y15DRAFT_350825 [Xylariaceae sp. FL0016]|nr:hypothetical protein F5Y15DRAFT_350825 [Xylariaceae sp. FL0016]
MATPGGSLTTIQQRAAENPEVAYRAFNSYPWQKDRLFASQLANILDSITPNGSNLSGPALEAQINRFHQQTGITINREEYHQWLSANSKKPSPFVSEQAVAIEASTTPDPSSRKLAHLLIELGDPLGHLALQQTAQTLGPEDHPDLGTTASSSDPSVPSWQSAAPTAELYIDKRGSTSDPDKEPYPKKFEEIVEFLQTGKEIPGIRKIPDTVVEDPSISTTGTRAAPRKPWER